MHPALSVISTRFLKRIGHFVMTLRENRIAPSQRMFALPAGKHDGTGRQGMRLRHDDVMSWKRYPQCWYCEGKPPFIGGFPLQRASNSFDVLTWKKVSCRSLSGVPDYFDFEWLWSVPLSSASLYWEFSFILFDLCLFMTIFNFILNYVPTVTFWIFTYHKIWILLIIFCFIWSYWIIYFLTCLEVFWSVVS